MNIYFLIKFIFFKFSKILLFSKVFKKKQKKKTVLNYIKILPIKIKKKYTRRFYRKVLFKRYDRKIRLKKADSLNWASNFVWKRCLKLKFNFKHLFHIKTIFNLNEFLLYDFYNFHNSVRRYNKNKNLLFNRQAIKKPWKKINFFYYIKNSIDVFRVHTSKFFNFKHRTTINTTLFLKSFFSMTTLAYIWFFEYSVVYFCVKLRFAESMGQSLSLLKNSFFFVNFSAVFDKWHILKPNDIVQSLFSLYTLLKYKNTILKVFRFFKYTKKFFRKSIFRSRKKKVKLPFILRKAVWLNNTKGLNFRMFEVDYKSLTVIILPYNNPAIFFKYITLTWINFWNFKVSNWKYDT